MLVRAPFRLIGIGFLYQFNRPDAQLLDYFRLSRNLDRVR